MVRMLAAMSRLVIKLHGWMLFKFVNEKEDEREWRKRFLSRQGVGLGATQTIIAPLGRGPRGSTDDYCSARP